MLGSRPRPAARRTRAARAGVVAALVATLVLAGCSEDEPQASPSATPQPAGPTLLTFAVYGPPQVVTAYATIAANFTAEHPGTVVSVRPYTTATDAAAALTRGLDAGSQPDVFLAPVEAVPGLVEAKAIRRVDDLLGEREVDFGDGYNRYSLEMFSSDNALQCMPVDESPLVVYYNTDLVDLSKIPTNNGQPLTSESAWTLDQFAQAARNARARGVRGVYVEPSLAQLAPFVYSGGGQVVDDIAAPTTLELSSGSSSSALEKVLELVRDPLATFNEQQIARVPALQRFKNGRLGMILGYRSLTPELRQTAGLDFDVMALPRIGSRTTIGESTGMCLAAGSDHAGKAADFMAYAVSDASAALLAKTGYTVPTNVDVAHSDDFLQPGQRPATASVFEQNMRYIQAMPADSEAWRKVQEVAAPLLTRLFFDPLIEPLDERLEAIDDASEPVLTPETPTPSATPSSAP